MPSEQPQLWGNWALSYTIMYVTSWFDLDRIGLTTTRTSNRPCHAKRCLRAYAEWAGSGHSAQPHYDPWYRSFQYCLRPLSYTWAELYFQRYHIGPNEPKGNENIICTMMKYGETFYGRYTVITPAAVNCSESSSHCLLMYLGMWIYSANTDSLKKITILNMWKQQNWFVQSVPLRYWVFRCCTRP